MTVAVGGPRLGTDVMVDAEALVYPGAGRPFERIGVPTVVLHHGEVLVAVELALICPTDIALIAGRSPVHAPLVLGHEQVGRVVAIGPQRPPRYVDGRAVAVGDRVVWGVTVDCGRCGFCHAGDSTHCRSLRVYGDSRIGRGWELSGGFATHVHLLARTAIVRAPEALAARVLAQVSCATATVAAVLEPLTENRGLEGEVVIVSGAGLRALTATAMARAAGASVVVVEADRDRRELAATFGAHLVVEDRAALGEVLAHGAHQLDLTGPPRYAPRHLARAVEFLERAADAYPFAALVGEQFDLAEAKRAFAHAAEHEVTRVGLRPAR